VNPLWLLLSFAAPVAAAPSEERLSEIKFAEQRFGGWDSEALTQVDYDRPAEGKPTYPYVRDVQCRIRRNGMAVTTNRSSIVNVALSGEDPSGDEDNRNFSTPNIRSLRIDRIHYEAKGVDTLHFRRKFSGVPYPVVENEDVILPIFGGHVAIRQRSDEPWLHIVSLLPRMLSARSLEIGHAHIVDGRLTREYRLTVPLAGLREALLWCERQVGSEAAYRFPAR
jgi:hypothetical protein